MEEAGTGEVDTIEAGMEEAGIDEAGTDEAGTDEVGTVEAGTGEACTVEAGTDESGTDESGTGEVGIDEAGTVEVGTGEACTVEAGTVFQPPLNRQSNLDACRSVVGAVNFGDELHVARKSVFDRVLHILPAGHEIGRFVLWDRQFLYRVRGHSARRHVRHRCGKLRHFLRVGLLFLRGRQIGYSHQQPHNSGHG